MDEQFWYLKQCPLFEQLSPEQNDRLEHRERSRVFQRGSVIYLPSDQSDSVLLLTSGRVRLYHLTADGKQALLALIDPGEIFGELALLEGGHREEFAEAMETTQVVAIPKDAVQQLMEEQSHVSLSVTRLLGLRQKKVERRFKSLLFHSNRERLVYLLVELLEKYGQPEADGIRITIRLSHQDLANIIGSTRETVTVLLGELSLDGSLVIKKRKIYVPNPQRLANSIGVPAPDLPASAPPHLPQINPARAPTT